MNCKTFEEFEIELKELINKHSVNVWFNTPDYLLARFLMTQIESIERYCHSRDEYFGRVPEMVMGESKRSVVTADGTL